MGSRRESLVAGVALTVRGVTAAGERSRRHDGNLQRAVPQPRHADRPLDGAGAAGSDAAMAHRRAQPTYLQVYLRLQLALAALLIAISVAPAPWTDRAETATLALVCLGCAFICWRREALPSPTLIWVTLAAVVSVSLVEAATPQSSEAPWAAMVATGLLTVGVAAGRLTRFAAATVTTAVIASWAAELALDHAPAEVVRVLLVAALAVAVTYGVTAVRKQMGRRAEAAARAEASAAAQARRDELRRHQLLLHDHATLLAVLATRGLPPELEAAARRQAADAARTVRTFLAADAGDPRRVGDAPMTLDQIVRSVASEFRDLPLEVVSGLATERAIGADQAGAVHAALTTVLHNVRRHAHADHVVVHADHPADSPGWEVYVRDDGVGFDVTTTRWGFGLREQAAAELERVGLNLTVWSEPSEGTRVVISAPGRTA